MPGHRQGRLPLRPQLRMRAELRLLRLLPLQCRQIADYSPGSSPCGCTAWRAPRLSATIRAMGPSSKEHPLLRTLVVCGASLLGLGCGGQAASDGNADGGRASVGGSGGQTSGSGGGAATPIRCPEQCQAPAQFVCDDASTATNCRCDDEAPLSQAACETVWDFSCEFLSLAPDCAPFLTLNPKLACTCADGQLHPEDCEYTSQFTCAQYTPVADGCRCDADAPKGAQDCPEGMQYRCYQLNPEVGCSCDKIELIK